MNDIFSDMQSRINVSYISDMPYYKQRVLLEMKNDGRIKTVQGK